MRSVWLAILFLTAVPAQAAPKDSKKLVADLKEYQRLKAKENFLKTVIARSKSSTQQKYMQEYEELKPKLYDAAQRMELGVQGYERKHGKKALCGALTKDVVHLVPSCAQK